MKTRLLKKVRERFQIIYYPHGIPLRDDRECVCVYDYARKWDTEVKWISIGYGMPKEKAFEEAYNYLKKMIYDNYKQHGKRRLKKQPANIVWHKSINIK